MTRRLHLSWQAPPSVEHILTSTAREYGVTLAEITGKSHRPEYVIPRHEACLRAREHGFSLSQIGKPLGRDHTTILNAINRAAERRREANV